MHFIILIVTHLIAQVGYAGVFVWMLLESACIPIPSEAIMPFAGALITTKHLFNINALAFVGAFGNLAGSAIAYGVGAWKGRTFFEKYGKYVLIRKRDIAAADRWFNKYGHATVFFTRMLPVIRTFISLPAGISRMPFGQFCVYTFFGALAWCYLLAYAGMKLGEHWDAVAKYTHRADLAIVVICIVLFGLWLYNHLRPEPEASDNSSISDTTNGTIDPEQS